MAVLCPIFDPYYGWYIIDPSGKKTLLSSLLYYYHSLGVNPPVGAKITQDDYDEYEAELDSENYDEEDADYDDLDYLPTTYSGNFMSKLSHSLPPSVQFPSIFAGFPSLSEGVNQTPSTTLTVPYAPITLPNYLVDPAMHFIGQQPLSHTYPNQSGPMTEPYNSYLSTMLPLPLPTSKMTKNEVMDTLDDEDEFEEEDSFMYDCSSTQSSLNSEMSYNNTI